MRLEGSTPDAQAYDILIQSENVSVNSNPDYRRRRIHIDKDWSFRDSKDSPSTALPVAQFPTNIHLDLYHNKLIADPFHGKNERDLQWIGLKSWTYHTNFPTPDNILNRTALCFDGLDTFAKVIFNDKKILASESMFSPARVDVTNLLRSSGQTNNLTIIFESTWLKGLEIVKDHPDHHWGCSNGHPSRLAVRKAQYHYGWDWGPKFMTCGPWRPIYLETFCSRVPDLEFSYELTETLDQATLQVNVREEEATSSNSNEPEEGLWQSATTMRIVIYDPDESPISNEVYELGSKPASVKISIKSPRLWYPARYGEQPLYRVAAIPMTENGDITFDHVEQSIGLRRIELVENEIDGQPGRSFYFRVNNIPIFCGGSCWIPGDNFLPRLKRKDYREWVRLVADGNQSMIRVWGGGIYEDDAFYEACDELGILVWQDFMFACGAYPAHREFLVLVEKEARANIKRLMHHPCIVVWAGNNEDYQYQEQNGLEYDPGDKDPESWLRSSFPARYIYEKLLPDTLQELSSNAIYRFGSPFGGKASNDTTVGDIHQWNVWHGEQRPYQDWSSLTGRFISEFGMQALPDMSTIDAFMNGIEQNEWHPYSSTMDFHNKAVGQARRMAMYMSENLRFELQPLRKYSYLTQLMQADCLGNAFRAFKRNWGFRKHKQCGGALVWQLNDCWPCASWSIVDCFRRPKLAYFAIKREMATLTISMDSDSSRGAKSSTVRGIGVWATNLSPKNITVDLVYKVWDIETGTLLGSHTIPVVTLPANCTVEVGSRLPYHVGSERGGADSHLRAVAAVYLCLPSTRTTTSSRSPQVPPLARFVCWPEPLKYSTVHITAPIILVEIHRKDELVRLRGDLPVKGVLLSIRTDKGSQDGGVTWADNGIDLVPGEFVEVKARGIGNIAEEDVMLNWYGDVAKGRNKADYIIKAL